MERVMNVQRTMTVSELIKSVCDKAEQHWVDCVKADLYSAGFNPDWTDPDYEDLQNNMRGRFTEVLRPLYEFDPVLVNDDPEDE
jgi:putative NADPH-quinone reductase